MHGLSSHHRVLTIISYVSLFVLLAQLESSHSSEELYCTISYSCCRGHTERRNINELTYLVYLSLSINLAKISPRRAEKISSMYG